MLNYISRNLSSKKFINKILSAEIADKILSAEIIDKLWLKISFFSNYL